MAFHSWSPCLHHHHTQCVWCWGSDPGSVYARHAPSPPPHPQSCIRHVLWFICLICAGCTILENLPYSSTTQLSAAGGWKISAWGRRQENEWLMTNMNVMIVAINQRLWEGRMVMESMQDSSAESGWSVHESHRFPNPLAVRKLSVFISTYVQGIGLQWMDLSSFSWLIFAQ